MSNITTTRFLGDTQKSWMVGPQHTALPSTGQIGSSSGARDQPSQLPLGVEMIGNTSTSSRTIQNVGEPLYPPAVSEDLYARPPIIPLTHHISSSSASPILANTRNVQKEATLENHNMDETQLLSPAPSEDIHQVAHSAIPDAEGVEQEASHNDTGTHDASEPRIASLPDDVRLTELAARFGGVDALERRLASPTHSHGGLQATAPMAQSAVGTSINSWPESISLANRGESVPVLQQELSSSLPSNATTAHNMTNPPASNPISELNSRRQPSEDQTQVPRLSSCIPALQAILSSVQQENSRVGHRSSLAETRLKLLKEACETEDHSYLTLHQLFSIQSLYHGSLLDQPLSAHQIKGFDVLTELILPNSTMAPQTIEWFSRFPKPLNSLLANPLFRLKVYNKTLRCFEFLGRNYEAYKTHCLSRQTPPLVIHMETELGVKSKTLQRVIFTAIQRSLWVGPHDTCFGRGLKIFSRNQVTSEYFKHSRTTPTPIASEVIETYYKNLVAEYESLYSTHRNHLQGFYAVNSSAQQPASVARPAMPPPQQASPLLSSNPLSRSQNTSSGSSNRGRPLRSTIEQTQDASSNLRLDPVASRRYHMGLPSSPAPMNSPSPLSAQFAPQPTSAAICGSATANDARLYQQGLPIHTTDGRAPPGGYVHSPLRTHFNQLAYGSPYAAHTPVQLRPANVEHASSSFSSALDMPQTHSPVAQYFQAGPSQVSSTRRQSIPIVPVPRREAPSVAYNQVLRSSTVPHSLESYSAGAGHSPQVSVPQNLQVNRNSGTPSSDHINTRSSLLSGERLLPPPGAVLPSLSYPNQELHNLHLAHLRDPEISCADSAGKIDNNTRLYQYLKHLQGPYILWPQSRVAIASFVVSDESMASLPIDEPGMFGEPPSRKVQSGTQHYRFRCIKAVPAQSSPQSVWSVQETFWPVEMTALVNDVPLDFRRKGHFVKDLPVDITSLIRKGSNKFLVTMLRPGTPAPDAPTYMVAVEVIEVSDLADLRQKIPHLAREVMEARIKQQLSTKDPEVEVVTGHVALCVIDPFSSKLISTPVRGVSCKHYECFDLDIFLQTRSGSPTQPDLFRCPICDGDARPQSLVVDDWFVDVLRKIKDKGRSDVRAVMLNEQAMWWIEELEVEGERGDGTGRRKRGSMAPSTTKSKEKEVDVDVIEID